MPKRILAVLYVSVMGLTCCYKTTVFFTFISNSSTVSGHCRSLLESAAGVVCSGVTVSTQHSLRRSSEPLHVLKCVIADPIQNTESPSTAIGVTLVTCT